MNLMQLRYAVEVDRTRSISKAAEALYMGQPNLSRAIRELEQSLGVTLFRRTSKGISPTPEGEEFLREARNILASADALENRFRDNRPGMLNFSISVPRASYLACAFSDLCAELPRDRAAEVYYKETNSIRAVENLMEADYRLAVLRYQTVYEPYFRAMLKEKDLDARPLLEFAPVALFSARSPLAKKTALELSDLHDFIELAHPDPYVPSLPLTDAKNAELSDFTERRIFLFERASQMDLLARMEDAFMWVSPVPERLLGRYGLVQRPCPERKKRYRDLLVWRRGYRFSDLDKRFLELTAQYTAQP